MEIAQKLLAEIKCITPFCDVTPIDKYTILPLEQAIQAFNSEEYMDKCCTEWETLRTTIINNGCTEIWEKIYTDAKEYSLNCITNSNRAQKLITRLETSSEIFIGNMPFIGAVGEAIAFQNFKEHFYNQQLNIYKHGYWVCGFQKNAFLICMEY